jgi:hypothetical protein
MVCLVGAARLLLLAHNSAKVLIFSWADAVNNNVKFCNIPVLITVIITALVIEADVLVLI